MRGVALCWVLKGQVITISHQRGEPCPFLMLPVHPSYGRVKQNVDGCLFVWMGGGQVEKNIMVSST